jgi:thiamine biosynthesis lipoprotein
LNLSFKISLIFLIFSHILFSQKTEYKTCMGSTFKLTLCNVKDNDSLKFILAWKEIDRIEKLISSWIDSSEISKINNMAGKAAVSVSEEVFKLLKLSQEIYFLTQGAFDLSIKPALKIWNWKSGKVPSGEEVKLAKSLVGFNKIVFTDSVYTVFLPIKGMHLDLGGIGKGYAAYCVAKIWKEQGISAGVINAGGDLYVFGNSCNSNDWNISIRNPLKNNEVIYTLKQTNISVTTSGDYERFFTKDSVKYSHILNPKTCTPVKGITSVTVFSADPVLADALATSLSVMGVTAGLDLINQMDGVDAIMIQSDGRVFFSNQLILK